MGKWPTMFTLLRGHLNRSLKEVKERGVSLWGKRLPGKGIVLHRGPKVVV